MEKEPESADIGIKASLSPFLLSPRPSRYFHSRIFSRRIHRSPLFIRHWPASADLPQSRTRAMRNRYNAFRVQCLSMRAIDANSMNLNFYIYIYIYIYIYVCVYAYIWEEKESERAKESNRERKSNYHDFQQAIYIYLLHLFTETPRRPFLYKKECRFGIHWASR